MNINELDAFNLADAVKFHDRLNPRLWDDREHLRPDVHAKLLEIAEDFKEFLGIDDLQVRDITISGSNAAFNYTPHSDIDLHIVADLPEADTSEVFRELFDAKKYQYNDQNDIRIGGYDVELYVQNPNQPHYSQGIYSLLQNKWLSVPKRRRADVKDISVKSKYEDIGHRIESAIESGDEHQMDDAWAKLKNMRQQGLEQQGEFSPENLAFKILRNNGTIQKLKTARQELKNKSLSLPEARKPVVYGFVTESPDGVNPSTKQILETEHQYANQVQEFIRNTADQLDIENIPKVELHDDPDWSIDNHSFGMYEPESHVLHVNLHNRHLLDILRTVAHELAHCRQHEIESLTPSAGETGSRFENEAHAVAGIIMRNYADANPEMFGKSTMHENASGYIPRNKKEAKDPRYSMAVSVDIKPGQVGKEANKLALNTGRNGEPGLLMKSANLRESRMPQPSQGQGKYRDLNAPLGPEFKPTMPKGTVRVDVSDVYDWYKLGKHIPNLDRADPGEFGKGPPSTIVSFGDEDTEHKYINDLEKLGLTTTDIDPVDPDQPPGMPRQKTDPTYNVAENELTSRLREELELFEEQDLFEVKMTSGNLAKLARDIKGVKVGLEFEMIVPNTDEPGDSDMEPDYDQDERVRDIDDAVNFFDDGDYNSSGQIRRLRDQMYEDFWTWRSEQADNDWYNGSDGFDYFRDYLEREDPFDEEEAEEEARNELQAQYGDELDVEEFEKMLFALVDEKRESYVQDQWDEQGRNFDDAREEYMEERVDDYSEQDWLENQGIRYASDVESNYGGDITWPYYTSGGSDDTDVKQVALNFMNAMGMNSVAVSDSYHGNYERWNGSEWVDIGRNKPDDCFAIEPDGSLEGNESSDAGLEFVSPPIPLEDIGTVMKKVQAWAADNGVYTGKENKTSIHTNISVPGYDIKNLDYLKAALLLGDEHVLREFDRIGNSYAKPAIDKVRQLVKSRPEKAKELLDKMKSQLNAEASKLLHSGITDKFTSINTKDNRIEFRSPGGDYLSIIADDPQKMIDTINRMVVTMDAAIDPNKYKQEYQKKLYKLLTGQGGGREARTGAKQEMKKDDKDLLNIFSRYAAGELPKAALKSFVRQAQLQRKVAKGEETGKMWWNVEWDNGRRLEVVASSEQEAKDAAAKEWGIRSDSDTARGFTAKPLRPYTEPPAGSELERIERQAGVRQGVSGLYKIFSTGGQLIAGDTYGSDREALERAQHWAQRRGQEVVVRNDQGQEIGRVSASGEITPAASSRDEEPLRGGSGTGPYEIYNRETGEAIYHIDPDAAVNDGEALDYLRNYRNSSSRPTEVGVRRRTDAPAQQNQGNWGIWIDGNNRFANQPGTYARGAEIPLMRFPSREAAESWLAQQRAERAGLRTDIEVREIPPRLLPGSTLDLQRQRAAQASPDIDYEIYNRQTGEVVDTAQLRNDNEAMIRLNDYRNHGPHRLNPEQAQRMFGIRRGPGVSNAEREPVANIDLFPDMEADLARARAADAARGGIVDVAGEQPAQGSFTGEWKVVDANGQELYRFSGVGNSQADANRVAAQWAQRNMVRDEVSVVPVMGAA